MIALRRVVVTALPLLLATAVIPACAAPPAVEEAGDGDDPGPSTGPGGTTAPVTPTPTSEGPEAKAGACPYDGPPVDVSGFAKCLDGGRCVPAAVIPESERTRLATCSTGLCVPEKIIKAKGILLPKTCKSLADSEGRCMSTVLPELDKQKASLPVDACDPNERCVPCFDPGSGKPTGACSSIACDAPKTKPVPFAACCKSAAGVSRGRCVPKATLPPTALANLEKKECTDDALCAPAENFDPKYVPPKCSASALLGKYDGVCFSTCVKQDFFAQLGTAQGNCATGSFCAPCKNPLNGAPTGAPGCAP